MAGGAKRIGRSVAGIVADMPRRCPLRGGGCREAVLMSNSFFGGLVLMTAIVLPSRRRPPTNSLPPLLCPWPMGRLAADPGMGLAELGEWGGLRKARESGGREAPGLKLNAGSAACRELSTAMLRDLVCISTADRGRLRLAIESCAGEGGAAGNEK